MRTRVEKRAEIKARCEPSLRANLEQIAYTMRLELSDVIRIACYQFAEQKTPCPSTTPSAYASAKS